MLGLFRKKFAKLAAKGDRCYERREFGFARGEYLAALAAFRDGDDPAEKTRVEGRHDEVCVKLAANHLEDAKRHLKAGMFDRAFSILESVEDLAEGRDDALWAEADALLTAMEKGEIGEDVEEEAPREQTVDELVSADDDHEAEFDLLIQTLPEARQAAYREAGAHFRNGYLVLNDGDAEAALSVFAGAPDSSWVRYERGRAHLLLGHTEDAVGCFSDAADAIEDALVVPVLGALAQAAASIERYELAEASVARLTDIEGPDSPDAITLRMAVLSLHERHDEADREALAFLKRNPSQLRVWRALGNLREQAERPRKAVEAYERVMGLKWRFDPDRRVVDVDVFSASRLARLLVEAGEGLDRAQTIVNALSLVVDDDSRWGLSLLRAEALEKQGELDEARDTLNNAIEAAAGLPEEVRDALAVALAKVGSQDDD